MTTTSRMTAAQLTEAADAIAPTAHQLPPMQVTDVLDHLAYELTDRLADLWTLRAAVDAHLTGAQHAAAIASAAELAEHYGHALDEARALAEDLDHLLPIDCSGPLW